MTDPISAIGLAATVCTTFREVYVIGRFIYNTIEHVKKGDTEREDLQVEFMNEMLYLESFGRIYLSKGGIMSDEGLDERWAKQIYAVLERLQKHSASFQNIAAYEDPEYQAESPYQNPKKSNLNYMDFGTFEDKPLSPKSAKKPIYNRKSWRWALLDRRKYEDILAKFQKWVGKLKDLLPLSIASSLKRDRRGSSTLEALSKNENVKNLGLEGHVQLWQLMLDPAFQERSLELDVRVLEAPSNLPEDSALGLAKLGSHPPKQKFQLFNSREPEGKTKVLVEYKSEDPNALPATQSSEVQNPGKVDDPIHRLASLLSLSGKYDLRTLSFKGYVHQPKEKRYAFVFGFPETAHRSVPISLNALIATDSIRSQLSLPDRFSMAQTITRTLAAFHSANWVHKSIRSQSFVLFSKPEDERSRMIKSPYLINFEYSRQEKANTVLASIENLEQSLYCHPQRNPPAYPFTKIHDIYALGVVLLEIGLWCTALSIYDQYRARMTETAKAQQLTSRQIKAIMVDAAKNRLSHHMGPAYTTAVLKCLRDELEEYAEDADFPIIFQTEIVENLDIKAAG
ncbi:MAG: hypothetical protein Q9191_007935 [Dirinaria sp. TL-2023a]